GIRGSKLERVRDFGTRRRHAGIVHNLLNEHQNLSLPRGEIAHFPVPVYKTSLLVLYTADLMSGSSGVRAKRKVFVSIASATLRIPHPNYLCTLKVVSVEIAVLAALGNNVGGLSITARGISKWPQKSRLLCGQRRSSAALRS